MFISGKGAKQIFKSKWKFYDQLNFLRPYVKPLQTISSLSHDLFPRDSDGEENEFEDEDVEQEDNEVDEFDNDDESEEFAIPLPPTPPRRKPKKTT